MATTDTPVQQLVINKLTKEQYENIATPNPTELYFVPETPASTTNLGPVKVDGVTITAALDGTISSTAVVTVDSAINATSTNPVQNKIIYAALQTKANDTDVVHTTGNETIAGNKTFTGTVVAPIIQTGSAANNYFQSQKFRGEGDANTYYHAVDFGYSGHDRVDFYDYGGVFQFHKHQGAGINDQDTVLGTINDNGWEGNVLGNVTGNSSSATGVLDQNNTSTIIKTWIGTKAQYDAILTKDANTKYIVTDDDGFIGVIVDSELSSTSTNPVQNKVIYEVIGDIETLINAL